ncbi:MULTISPECIES: Z-ring formation inhibitor MciZ [Fictibacillus]|uniref:Z-ring formation inhibitor MciZ n=1 Tax=Fictibacillus terranigra TaxID=3058424 RepID=A0ABT8E9U6_9BACL|nr:Z-ring formation inhibitor MciZ [Fictibacillus sp. CENA-BCM004]MDN4074644.1 Z-ring formation inhibitor MciZ [Fictibacillus sp. CENA-BCM004]
MKVYIQQNGVTMVGKAWQIKYMLKQYMKQHSTVKEWITSVPGQKR